MSVLDQSRSLFSIDAVIGDLGAAGDIEVEHLQSEGAGLVHEFIVEHFGGVTEVTQVQACRVGYTRWDYLLGKSEVTIDGLVHVQEVMTDVVGHQGVVAERVHVRAWALDQTSTGSGGEECYGGN